MQQHPIPQDITGYRFHIIGSMTLKQFGEVLLGVMTAVAFYSTNLIVIVKWPLIILSVGMGVVAAFVPIQERPLSHWISTFIKILYKPTKFFWEREAKVPEVFSFESSASTVILEPEIDLTPIKQQRIKEYLGSVSRRSQSSTSFSQDEVVRMKNILASFKTTNVSALKTKNSNKSKPNLDVRVRSMRKPKQSEENLILKMDPTANSTATLNTEVKKEKTRKVKKTILASNQVAHKIQVPQQETIKLKVGTEAKNKQTFATSNLDHSKKIFIKDQVPTQKNITVTKDINFNTKLPFPIKPTKPNKLVGMVLSKSSDLLTGSIIEVQTPDGHIERAVKTNALGQFFITTPLKPGDYNIIVEKEGYVFSPLHIKIDGSIVEPVEIRSKN